MSVFRNHRSPSNNFLKQSHPKVGVVPYTPRKSFYVLIQPTEKGSFFKRTRISGAGSTSPQKEIPGNGS